MRKLILSLSLIVAVFFATAQNEYETILKEIETNSTTLSTLREQMEVDKLNNRTGIYLDNPEVEFNYLWGSPSMLGKRTDVRVTQTFDFPTVYGYRNKISQLENTNLNLIYKSERMNLLLQAKQICIELAYLNALAKEYVSRLDNARLIAEAYQAKFDKGDANMLENNKAQLNLATVENELKRIEIGATSLLLELKAMNGGNEIAFTVTNIENELLPANFTDWYAVAETKNPVLQHVKGQIEIDRQQISMNKALGLPKFTAGYMSEGVVDEKFQGITIGISVPLWENKNKVKHARAQIRATETALENNKIQFYNRLQNLFAQSSGLRENALKYRNSLSSYNNENLLKKALDSGEISILNYLLEIEYYYDAVNKVLELERDCNLSIAELSAVEL